MKIEQGIYLLNDEEGADGYFSGRPLKYLFLVTNKEDLLIALEDWANDKYNSFKVADVKLTRSGNYQIKLQVKDWTDDPAHEMELYLIRIPTALEWSKLGNWKQKRFLKIE